MAAEQRLADLVVPVGTRPDVGTRDEALDGSGETAQRGRDRVGEGVVVVLVADEDSEPVIRYASHCHPSLTAPAVDGATVPTATTGRASDAASRSPREDVSPGP